MLQTQPNPNHQQETERLADEFARTATRDILKPDHGLSVLEALEKKSARNSASHLLQTRSGISPKVADAVSETRRLVDDLGLRIIRQQRRVEKIILERHGPREEMESLLDDMIKARDMMRRQLEGFEQERRGRTDDHWPPMDATSPSRG